MQPIIVNSPQKASKTSKRQKQSQRKLVAFKFLYKFVADLNEFDLYLAILFMANGEAGIALKNGKQPNNCLVEENYASSREWVTNYIYCSQVATLYVEMPLNSINHTFFVFPK